MRIVGITEGKIEEIELADTRHYGGEDRGIGSIVVYGEDYMTDEDALATADAYDRGEIGEDNISGQDAINCGAVGIRCVAE